MASNISNLLIKIDSICDYIPIISTGSNLIDLCQKSISNLLLNRSQVANSHYYTHLQQKSISRCFILLIPVIGNITIGIYDFSNRYSNKAFMLKAIRKDVQILKYASKELKEDKDFMLEAIRLDRRSLEYASEELKDDEELMFTAVNMNGWALKYASERLKENKELVFTAAVDVGASILQCASKELREDEKFMLDISKIIGEWDDYTGKSL